MKIKIIYEKKNLPPDIPKDVLGAWEIASWLADDIQESIKLIDEYLQEFADYAKHKKPGIGLGVGNAHGIFIHENYVYLECEFDEEQKVLLTTEQMISVLEQYKVFIKKITVKLGELR